MSHNDPPLPLGAKGYLESFDRLLAATSAHDLAEQVAARREMRQRFDLMVAVRDPAPPAARRRRPAA